MKVQLTPAGKVVVAVLGVVVLGAGAVLQAPDIKRYIKSERM